MTYRLLKSLAKKLSRRDLNARLKAFIEALPDGATVLNVGSGGEIMAQIEAAGNFGRINVTSTDIDPGRSPDVVDDLTRSELPTAAFDAVVCAEVLEHVTDPPALLHKSGAERSSPFPGRTYPTATVTGMPSAV